MRRILIELVLLTTLVRTAHAVDCYRPAPVPAGLAVSATDDGVARTYAISFAPDSSWISAWGGRTSGGIDGRWSAWWCFGDGFRTSTVNSNVVFGNGIEVPVVFTDHSVQFAIPSKFFVSPNWAMHIDGTIDSSEPDTCPGPDFSGTVVDPTPVSHASLGRLKARYRSGTP